MIETVAGFKVMVSTLGTSKRVQFRFPRCKSRRIGKKWAKREKNFKIEYLNFMFGDPASGGNIIVIHPAIKRHLEELPVVKERKAKAQKEKEKQQWQCRFDFGVQPCNRQSILNLAACC